MCVNGCWREVRATGTDNYPSGGLAVWLSFTDGARVRMPAAEPVTVIPRNDWSLGYDGRSPVFEVACTTCGASPPASHDSGARAPWCLDHARQTNHTGFRTTTTAHLRAFAWRQKGAGADADA